MIPRKPFVLSTILILRIRWHNSFICTQAHSTQHDIAPFKKLFFKPM